MTFHKPRLYTASKIIHAPKWRELRDVFGFNVISSWIDQAGKGETKDMSQLWVNMVDEVKFCDFLLIYKEPQDTELKGAWVELGVALASSRVAIYAVGIEEYTVAKHPRIIHFPTLQSAILNIGSQG